MSFNQRNRYQFQSSPNFQDFNRFQFHRGPNCQENSRFPFPQAVNCFQNQGSPNSQEINRFQSRYNPYPRSPVSDNQGNSYSPRNSSPRFHQFQCSTPKQFTSPNSSDSRKSSSGNSTSSYFGDVSHGSPYNSPNTSASTYNSNRNSGNIIPNNNSPYNSNRNFGNNFKRNRYQGNRSFQSPSSSDSNPGHAHDIRRYIHPSMLEDPWKHLVAKTELQ